MSDPPQAHRVSPDGKFYWDGQDWMPMQRTSQRLWPWVATLVAFAIIFVFVLFALGLWLWSPG
jgi:hypothetical protein